jgi:hypothetical protein
MKGDKRKKKEKWSINGQTLAEANEIKYLKALLENKEDGIKISVSNQLTPTDK